MLWFANMQWFAITFRSTVTRISIKCWLTVAIFWESVHVLVIISAFYILEKWVISVEVSLPMTVLSQRKPRTCKAIFLFHIKLERKRQRGDKSGDHTHFYTGFPMQLYGELQNLGRKTCWLRWGANINFLWWVVDYCFI